MPSAYLKCMVTNLKLRSIKMVVSFLQPHSSLWLRFELGRELDLPRIGIWWVDKPEERAGNLGYKDCGMCMVLILMNS